MYQEAQEVLREGRYDIKSPPNKIIDNTRLGKPPTYGKGFAKDREEYINLTKEMS
jgi:hypothetical protein